MDWHLTSDVHMCSYMSQIAFRTSPADVVPKLSDEELGLVAGCVVESRRNRIAL